LGVIKNELEFWCSKGIRVLLINPADFDMISVPVSFLGQSSGLEATEERLMASIDKVNKKHEEEIRALKKMGEEGEAEKEKLWKEVERAGREIKALRGRLGGGGATTKRGWWERGAKQQARGG